MARTNDRYWAFVASLAKTMTLAKELSTDDNFMFATMGDLVMVGQRVEAVSRTRLQDEQKEMIGAIEVIAQLRK